MSEQLELFIGNPPGDEPGKTKIADGNGFQQLERELQQRQRQHEQPPEREPGSSPRRNR